MPIYQYFCPRCAVEIEKVQNLGVNTALCPKCGGLMIKKMTSPAMIKMKGEGGYPSRRKQVRGTAPYTSGDVKPWLDSNPHKPNWLSSDARRREGMRAEISKPSSL